MRSPYYAPSRLQLGSGDFPIYHGSMQRGAGLGSLFRGLWKFAFPIAKSIGRTVGKQAFKSAGGVAKDVIGGRDLQSSLEDRAGEGAKALVRKAASGVRKRMQKGRGLSRARKRRVLPIKASQARRKKRKVDSLG